MKKAVHRRKELFQEFLVSESTPKSHRKAFTMRRDSDMTPFSRKDAADMDVSPTSPATPARVHLSRMVKPDHIITKTICTPPSPSPARSRPVAMRDLNASIASPVKTSTSMASSCKYALSESKQSSLLTNVEQQMRDSELPYLSSPSQCNDPSFGRQGFPSIPAPIFPPPRSSSIRSYPISIPKLYKDKL